MLQHCSTAALQLQTPSQLWYSPIKKQKQLQNILGRKAISILCSFSLNTAAALAMFSALRAPLVQPFAEPQLVLGRNSSYHYWQSSPRSRTFLMLSPHSLHFGIITVMAQDIEYCLVQNMHLLYTYFSAEGSMVKILM
jgi:hypothetical protein